MADLREKCHSVWKERTGQLPVLVAETLGVTAPQPNAGGVHWSMAFREAGGSDSDGCAFHEKIPLQMTGECDAIFKTESPGSLKNLVLIRWDSRWVVKRMVAVSTCSYNRCTRVAHFVTKRWRGLHSWSSHFVPGWQSQNQTIWRSENQFTLAIWHWAWPLQIWTEQINFGKNAIFPFKKWGKKSLHLDR